MNTAFIPDYYLKGSHKLSITSNNTKTSTKIHIGTSENPTTNLSPVISEVKALKVKDFEFNKDNIDFAFKPQHDSIIDDITKAAKETPIALKIKGKNFMMFYNFCYPVLDGKKVSGHSTAISKDSSGNIVYESIIHLDIKEFMNKTSHSISYYTPFGVVIKSF